MQINTFKDMYTAELSELHDAERQIGEALSRLMGRVRHDGLKQILTTFRDQGQAHRSRITDILGRCNVNPDRHKDQSVTRLIEETEKMEDILSSPDLADAGLIASLQKIAHYQIAAYGTAATYADVLGFDGDKGDLHQILDEQKAIDTRLTTVAKSVVNPDAARAA